MFEQTFVNTHAQTRRPWTVALSLGLQTGLIAIVLVLPLLHPEVLHPKLDVPIWVSLHQAKPEPPPEVREVRPMASSRPRPLFDQVFHMPIAVPRRIDMSADAPELQNLMMVGTAAQGSTVIPGFGNALPDRPEPQQNPPVRKMTQEPPRGPMHVSTGVQSAKLIFSPRPPYPPLAKTARVQGTVKIQAVIAADGTIKNLQVISGPPLLVKAAIDAVSQWRYQPTLLSGNPVEVITEIDVNFMLSQ